ncbi:type II toxin-antitoxin system VapC family toxin [Dyadobacter sp. BHUBP1]|uniref:type II toxin-antitoxin system VapC family toxin n=1 Tax=Dyadobacter sp. BHUBP1 TaxID=3424178 RepID=UPI003D353D4D
MKFLLDTHTLLWFIEGHTQMSFKAREIIENPRNKVVVSSASLFEIAIKLKIGKLALRKSLSGFLEDVENARIEIVPILNSHLAAYQLLPDLPDHRDPFDRLILATSISEGAELISKAPKFKSYRDFVSIIW